MISRDQGLGGRDRADVKGSGLRERESTGDEGSGRGGRDRAGVTLPMRLKANPQL